VHRRELLLARRPALLAAAAAKELREDVERIVTAAAAVCAAVLERLFATLVVNASLLFVRQRLVRCAPPRAGVNNDVIGRTRCV
jgi:hypothetical protein